MRQFVHDDDEQFALIKRTDKTHDKLAIFVHGFRGNYLTTWGTLPHLLSNEADNHDVYQDWDYAFLGYKTQSVTTYLDIAQFIWGEWRKAENGELPYNHPYKKLALIGHSLGTLGIRQALCAHALRPPTMISALHGVAYFGSPINGSPAAKYAKLFYKIGRALIPGNPQLRMLKGWTADGHRCVPWPKVRVIMGIDDAVVGYTASELMHWDGDDRPFFTGMNHTDMVKPNGWSTNIIAHIKACLQ